MAFNEPPWHPMSDPCDLKHMGKLGEELAEACQVVCRCIIQGINETDPTQQITNKEWLEKELADVIANVALVEQRFGLKIDTDRIESKMKNLRIWHAGA